MTGEPTILFCVGATKAGTSWLYQHLRGHPDCALRTIKELHYFDTVKSGWYRQQSEGHIERLFLREGASASLRQSIHRVQDTGDWLKILDQRKYDEQAYLAYLTGRLNGRKLVGDLSPSYALLPEARLEQMQALGKTRFVYLLRDPVARLWSHLRMLGARSGVAPDVQTHALALAEKAMNGGLPGVVARGDYAGTVARLRRAIDPSRLMVMLFDDMLSRPGLARLSAFLGISMREDVDFDRKVHPSPEAKLPAALATRLRAWLAPQYDFVSREFGGLPSGWMAAEGVA